MAGDGLYILLSVLVGLFDLVLGVAQVDVVALFAAQVRLARGLDAGLAGIVAPLVFARVAVHERLVHFGNVAEEIAAGVDRVVADAADLAPEAGIAVFDLIEAHVGLGRHLAEHDPGLVADRADVAVVFVHLGPEELRRHVQDLGEGQRVERLDLLRRDHDVIGDLVAHEDLPVAVMSWM